MGTLFISLEMGETLVYKRNNTLQLPDSVKINFSARDISEIVTAIRRSAKEGVKLVVIDSIMNITARDMATASRTDQLNYISLELSDLKDKLDISIILIVQSPKSEKAEEILTTKGAGDVDYAADLIVQFKEVVIGEPEREVRCTKNRENGVTKREVAKLNKNTLLFAADDNFYPSNGDTSASKEGVSSWK